MSLCGDKLRKRNHRTQFPAGNRGGKHGWDESETSDPGPSSSHPGFSKVPLGIRSQLFNFLLTFGYEYDVCQGLESLWLSTD